MESNGKEDQHCNSLKIANGEDGHGLFESEEEELRGQAEIWKHTFAFVDSLAVKCAVLLGIPNMIAAEGPLSLSQIAARVRVYATKSQEFDGPDVDIGCLFRILRLLASRNVFSASTQVNGNGERETIYGLTPASKWLLKDGMCPLVLMLNDEANHAPWHHFNECVLSGGMAFARAHGTDVWSYAATHPHFNKLFNQAMSCDAKIVMKAILSKSRPAFQSLRSVVDVGGGIGTAAAEIVRAFPQIRAINFDLPQVIATAPNFPGVEHIGGDMFAGVPSAEAVIMKSILHGWNDEDCVRILKNCRKAIPDDGKIIIVDVVIEEDGDEEKKDIMSGTRLAFDLSMSVGSCGGKERTEAEFQEILSAGGFSRYNIIKLPAMQWIIEAFPY